MTKNEKKAKDLVEELKKKGNRAFAKRSGRRGEWRVIDENFYIIDSFE